MKNNFLLIATITLILNAISLATEYDVLIGDKTYIVKDSEEITIVTPSGEELRLRVKKRPIITFEDSDVSFQYNSNMKVITEMDMGIKTITVECEDSTLFMIQIYPYQVSPNEAVDSIITGMKMEFVNFGATFPEDSLVESLRTFGKTPRKGKKLKYALGYLKHESEVYAYTKNEKTIAILLQADHEDRENAEKLFKIITDSIE